MIEKGVSAPPRFIAAESEAAVSRAGLQPLTRYLTELDIWFRRVRDNFARVQTYAAKINVGSVAANSTDEQTFTVAGLGTKDIVIVNKPSHTSGLFIGGCRVSAVDTLAITFVNITGAPINPAAETYLITAIRR